MPCARCACLLRRIADAIVEGNQIATEGGVVAAEPAEEAGEGEAAGGAGEAIAAGLSSDDDNNGGVSGGEAQSESMTSQGAEQRKLKPRPMKALNLSWRRAKR